MIGLDTDTLTFFLRNHPRVVERMQTATEEVAITIVSRIETLQGRFDSLMKAVDGIALQRGQQCLDEAERRLANVPKILPINAAAGAEFDRLCGNKKLKKIGRGDLLIASITLAYRARLVTRNLKDLRQVPGLHVENWSIDRRTNYYPGTKESHLWSATLRRSVEGKRRFCEASLSVCEFLPCRGNNRIKENIDVSLSPLDTPQMDKSSVARRSGVAVR